MLIPQIEMLIPQILKVSSELLIIRIDLIRGIRINLKICIIFFIY